MYRYGLVDGDNSNFAHSLFMKREMANSYEKLGDYKLAAMLYRESCILRDSLSDALLQRHEEILQNNYIIKKELSLYQLNKEKRMMFQIVSRLIMLGILLFFLVYLLRIRLQLKLAARKTKLALDEVISNDNTKEKFLKNITFETRTPLNTVVGFTDLLTIDKDLTKEEVSEYSKLINQSANDLLKMINMVLEISRLEAGMMHFNLTSINVNQLCDEVKAKLSMNGINNVD